MMTMECPENRRILHPLLLLLMQLSSTTGQQYDSVNGMCSNGCSYYLYYDPLPFVLTDDGTNCELACPVGIIQGSAANVNIDPSNNIIGCDVSDTNSHNGNNWCYSGGTAGASGTYWCSGTSYNPIVRGGMSSCSGVADTAPIAIDCSIYTNATSKAACDAYYGATTTSYTTPTTTTLTTASTTTIETSSATPTVSTTGAASTTIDSTTTGTTETTTSGTTETTTSGTTETTTSGTTESTTSGTTDTTTSGTTAESVATTTGTTAAAATGSTTTPAAAATSTAATVVATTVQAVPQGLCDPFTDSNGVLYDNRCVQYDAGATCNDNGEDSSCTCSAGQTGSNCGVSQSSLQTIGQLAGPSGDSQSIYDMILASKKSGTPTFTANMPALLSFLTDGEKADMSFTATDMIIGASYEGKSLNVDTAFTAFNDPSLGNCFTFNHWNASFHYGARMIGPRLKVQVDVMPGEYLPFIDTMGISIYITEVGAHIYVESNKIMSQPGGWDKIMMTRTTTQLLETPKSKCAKDISSAQSYYFDGNYSIDGCYRSCYQDSVYASCGCMDPMFSRKDGISACTYDKVPCIFDMQAKRGDPTTWPECTCYQPCFSQDYDVAYSRGLLADEVTCAQSGNYNASDACKPSQSYITVGFKTLEALVQVEVEKYPLSRVFGNFGNVGGLLLGFSMVSLFEWLFFGLSMLFISMNKETLAPSAGGVRKDY